MVPSAPGGRARIPAYCLPSAEPARSLNRPVTAASQTETPPQQLPIYHLRVPTTQTSGLGATPWAFRPDELTALTAFYRHHGFAVLSGAVEGATADALSEECSSAQRRLADGRLDARYGTDRFNEEKGRPPTGQPNYVQHITELSPTARHLLHSPPVAELVRGWLGPGCWSAEDSDSGFVYQDARPGPDSGYRRIGWHSDWQSAPHLDLWPATAVTVHLDATSPDNGFLRVVPGSHLWATPPPYENVNGAVVPAGSRPTGGHTAAAPPAPMPLRFEKVPGEVALYAERGDVLFHDCYLWHSAAVATSSAARRRHIRGSWFGGRKPVRWENEDFVKNAAR